MPKGTPNALPRTHAGTAFRSSARDSQGRPRDGSSCLASDRPTRLATWSTSPMASMATVMTTMLMPSNRAGTSNVKRDVPVDWSMPTSARARPNARAARPRTGDSETMVEIATNAKTASAKYSPGPNPVASSASVGAKNTTRTVAIMPPVKAPTAAVASACGALPSSAIRWPSKVVAIAVLLPGVFIRMPAVESPKSPPK